MLSGSGRVWLAIGVYALGAVVCTFPLVLHLADSMAPAPDTLLHSWILAWDVHALTTDPLHLYDANIYYPFPLSLTYSDAMLSGALLVAPVLVTTGNPVLAHNLLTLASLVLAGLGMYLLVRSLTGSDLGGLVAGGVFTFCTARQAHLEHVNLLQFGWLPLGLVCLRSSMQRGRTRDLILLACFSVCQVLASVYLAWMMAIAYAVVIGADLVFRRSAWQPGRLLRVAAALLAALVVVVPIMWPYARMQQIFQFTWPNDVLGDLSAVPSNYLAVPPQNVVYAGLLARFAPTDFPSEHLLFPGFVALILAAIGVVRQSRNVDVRAYATLACIAFGLSFGPVLRLDGTTPSIGLPYGLLLQYVPGFAVMRAPARFDFLLMLALGVLAGFGIASLSRALSPTPGTLARRGLLGALAAAAMLEVLPSPREVAPVAVGDEVPAVYGWLQRQDPNSVVAEMPVAGATGFASFDYEYFSTYHWHPLVNGNTGFEPPASKPIAKAIEAFPDPTAVADLSSLGVRYLVAHRDRLDSAAIDRLERADLAPLHVGIAATFGPDVVYELAPPVEPASLQDHVSLELPSRVVRGTTPLVALSVTNTTAAPLVVGAPQAIWARVEWNQAGAQAGERHDLPVFLEPGGSLRLVFPAALGALSAAADSTAVLNVRVSGAVERNVSQVVQIVDLPTSRQAAGLAASLERVQVPEVVRSGSSLPVEVTARNTGQAIWLSDVLGVSGGPGVVGVSIRSWTSADGQVLPASPNSTAHLQEPVDPGQAAELAFQTLAPTAPGHYLLALDMLSENVSWFADLDGGSPTLVPVDVVP